MHSISHNIRSLFHSSFQASPNGLCNYFPGGGVSTWILIRHGFRAWPIEVVNFQFGESWDTFSETHNLKSGFKSPCDVNESGFSILQSLKKVVKNLFTGGLVQICSGGNFMIHQVIMLPFVGIKHSVINKIQ